MEDLRRQQACRNSTRGDAALKPRSPSILEKLRSLSLCHPKANDVDSSIRRQHGSSGEGNARTPDIGRAHASSAHYATWRMDAPSPQSQTVLLTDEPESRGVVTEHEGTEAAQSSQAAPPPKKRRRSNIQPHPDDREFFNRLFAAYSGQATMKKYGEHLRRFSEWLWVQKKDGLASRINSDELDGDMQRYIAKAKPGTIPRAALTKIRFLMGPGGQFAQVAPPQRRAGTGGPVKADDQRWGRKVIPAEDNEMLNQFRASQLAAGFNENTVTRYVADLRQFSAWLHESSRPGLAAKINADDSDLNEDEESFVAAGGPIDLGLALNHLRTATTSVLGISQIQAPLLQIPDEDSNLINRFYKALLAGGTKKVTAKNYIKNLRQFSSWLSELDRPTLAARHGIDNDALNADLTDYLELGDGDPHTYSALNYLRRLSETSDPLKIQKGYETPEADSQLLNRFYTLGRGGGDRDDQVHASITSILYRFSAWLMKNDRQGLAARLFTDEAGLNADVEAFGNAENILLNVPIALKRLRYWTEGPGQSFFSGLSGQFAAIGPGINNALRDDAHYDGSWGGSYSHAAPALGDPSHSSYPGPSAAVDPHPAAPSVGQMTGASQPVQYVPAPPDRRYPRFGADDAGADWQHTAQRAPEWLLDRNVSNQDVVEICGERYRVVDMAGELYVYPIARGG